MPQLPPLALTEGEMRRLGYLVIDMLVDHACELSQKSVTRAKDRATLSALFREPPPQDGQDIEAVIETAGEHIFSNVMHVDHPRFFAFAPSPSNFVSAMADALASGFNVFTGVALEGSAAAEIEVTVLDWLRQICGLPKPAGGVLVSGGSMANLTALATARRVALGDEWHHATLYSSDQTHSSVGRAVSILGFRSSQLRTIPSDEGFRIQLDSLRKAIHQDRSNGLRPFCVVANAGTINTGAVDPLRDIADICKDERMWFHADGAYGAASLLTDEGKEALRGLELVDSLSLDPHKWLFQPYDIGCVLVRDPRWLEETFRVLPEYLKEVLSWGEGVNFSDRSPELTRRFRGLKLWMSVKAFGLDAFRRAVATGLSNARFAEKQLRSNPVWEVLTPASLGVVAFRYHPVGRSDTDLNRINLAISQRCVAGGFAMVVTTELRNQTALRLCTINPRTSTEDISDTIRYLERAGASAS
ncbi:MAG: aminotransferase class I/II-fold pyridoxal phosphate-dependent enzyme [Bryobacterales bacterium]|nr:aminotransferase class I/II-fold pyridoxal phosphate-dependent enzyme [Bryobacterales bacterium]